MEAQIIDSLAAMLCFSMPFLTGLGGVWLWLHYAYRSRELEVRQLEAKAQLERARLLAGAPEWLDPDDPAEVAAWRQSKKELVALTTRTDDDSPSS